MTLKRLKKPILLGLITVLSACGSGDGFKPKDWESMPVTDVDSATLQKSIESIDEFSINATLEHLTGATPAPLSTGDVTIAERGGTQGRQYARQYILETFASHGLVVDEHSFTSTSGKSGKNVEGIIPGIEGGKHLYVTAHLDSVNNKGANDNASGVTALLLAARALSQHRPRDTIHLVAVDLEELGYYGSHYYVRDRVLPLYKENPDQIIGNINADMVGYTSGANTLVLADCEDNGRLEDSVTSSISELQLKLNPSPVSCSGRSDHVSFYEQGMEALFAIDSSFDGEYPWYHEASDTMDRIDTGFLTEVTRALTAGVMKLAYPQT